MNNQSQPSFCTALCTCTVHVHCTRALYTCTVHVHCCFHTHIVYIYA